MQTQGQMRAAKDRVNRGQHNQALWALKTVDQAKESYPGAERDVWAWQC